MSGFKYEITKHPAEEFSQLVYFCTEQGECKVNDLPPDQLEVLRDALNERGGQGWELVQLIFGKDGIVAVWKRGI
ncbi:MAG: DUF4177 domain-containing protein [Desulfobacterales bacterium]|nr:DUF4177 domain-containing protein [Desulfobacterales bacterium]